MITGLRSVIRSDRNRGNHKSRTRGVGISSKPKGRTLDPKAVRLKAKYNIPLDPSKKVKTKLRKSGKNYHHVAHDQNSRAFDILLDRGNYTR